MNYIWEFLSLGISQSYNKKIASAKKRYFEYSTAAYFHGIDESAIKNE